MLIAVCGFKIREVVEVDDTMGVFHTHSVAGLLRVAGQSNKWLIVPLPMSDEALLIGDDATHGVDSSSAYALWGDGEKFQVSKHGSGLYDFDDLSGNPRPAPSDMRHARLGNGGRNRNGGLDSWQLYATDNSAGVNNEEDWAARARAWAAAKAAMDAQQAPSQFTQVGRSVEHHHVYQEHYPQAVQPQFSDIQQPSLSALGHQSVQLPPVSIPNMATNQVQDSTSHFPPDVSSSYTADGFMAYSLKDEQNVSSFSSQGSIPAGTHSYPQDLATNYTSISGVLSWTLNPSCLVSVVGCRVNIPVGQGAQTGDGTPTGDAVGAMAAHQPASHDRIALDVRRLEEAVDEQAEVVTRIAIWLQQALLGVEEQVKQGQASHSPLSSPMTLRQDEQLSQAQVQAPSTSQLPLQSTQQSHFTYTDQPVPPVLEVSHQQPEFEQHVAQDYHQHQQSSYLQPVPTMAPEGTEYNGPPPSMPAWPQLGGPGGHFPPVPTAIQSSHQFDHPYMSVPHPIHGHPPHLFGRGPGPQSGPGFRPNMPPMGGPFTIGPGSPGLPPGVAGMVGPAFIGDNNGTFGIPERPKKASVPNWLREELMKKKASVVANTPAQGLASEDSFHASGTEGAMQSFRNADQADSKSIDSARSSDDEDDEDEVEAARTAAINQEIKRVLTEVLLKVTDDLFDEIAQEVLDEDDNSTQAKKYGVNDRGRIRSLSKVSPPPPAIPTPTVSARVLISGKTSSAGSGDESGRSNSSAPGGNVLGLANYASDDDDDAEQPRRQQSTHREGDLLEENGNREEQSSQFRAEKRNITVNAGVEISRMDAKADTGEDKDEHRAREQSKDIMVNKEGREDLMGKKRLFTENQLDSQNVRSPDKNQGFESKDGAVSVSDEHEKPKAASKANVSKSGSKGMERYQPSSKDAHNEIDVDKGRSYDPQDREIKRKGNEKNEIKKSATRVNAEHGEENNKKVDNKQQDLVQHRKNGEKEREREKGRERDRDKAKEKEKNRVGDRKRAKEKLRDREGRRGSDRTHDKESRKDLEKERKATDKTDDRRSDKERGEKNGKGKQRDTKDTRKSRKRSSSVSSRGRNSKVDSYDSYDSSSGAEGNENARRRRVESSRRSSSPSPIIRSRKRCKGMMSSVGFANSILGALTICERMMSRMGFGNSLMDAQQCLRQQLQGCKGMMSSVGLTEHLRINCNLEVIQHLKIGTQGINVKTVQRYKLYDLSSLICAGPYYWDKFRGLVLLLAHHMPGILIAGIPLIFLMRAGASSQGQVHLLVGGDEAKIYIRGFCKL
eukprot:Gb_39408 [translate_table: standard]